MNPTGSTCIVLAVDEAADLWQTQRGEAEERGAGCKNGLVEREFGSEGLRGLTVV